MTTDPIVVIGAGPAGLAAAAELRRRGLPVLVLERAEMVASSWRARYDCLQLNTCRWNSQLTLRDRFKRGVPFFPVRDQVVEYLEAFRERHDVAVRFGVEVERIDRCPRGWELFMNGTSLTAQQVIVAIGHQHTPVIPAWPGRDRFPGRILHSCEYRNPEEFLGQDVLVVGAGCSGLDIATDLAHGGAARVRVAMRTPPNLLLKLSCGLPTDLLAAGLYRVPNRIADWVGRLLQRITIGDLSPWGVTPPATGIFTRLHEGSPPAIVRREVVAAIRARDFEIVADVRAVSAAGVELADGTFSQPDVLIAATGYGTGLEPILGHLGVLDDAGMPPQFQGVPVQPGLRFLGYAPCMGVIGRDARRVVRHLHNELLSTRSAVAPSLDGPTG